MIFRAKTKLFLAVCVKPAMGNQPWVDSSRSESDSHLIIFRKKITYVYSRCNAMRNIAENKCTYLAMDTRRV